MARGQKKENLTPEERLQAALVPESEQPYKIPGNWCWVKVGTVSKAKGGKRLPKGRTFLEEKSDYPYIRVTDFDNESICIENVKYIDSDTHMMIKNYTISSADIYISIAGTIGKVGIIPEELEGANLTENAAKITDINGAYQLYLMLFLKSEVAQNQMKDSTISTTQPKLALFRIEDILLPLPPLSEQQRIVDYIERLFAKLDEAKQKAQDALDSFETRKAAILYKAFAGELTAQWRKEHGVGMESWRRIPLKKCGSWYGGGTPSMGHPEYWENGTLLWVTSKDMKNDLIEDTLMHTNMLGVENSSANYIEEPAVLFVMRSGILRRTFPVCMVKKPFTVNQDLKALVPTDDINLEYLFWVCKANEKQILEKCMKSGTTVESINTTALRDFEIPIAEENEQVEIVRILDDLLTKEQQAKEAAEKVLEQIDLIKKSILARAFRGELGTNDPSEESAAELLRQVLSASDR